MSHTGEGPWDQLNLIRLITQWKPQPADWMGSEVKPIIQLGLTSDFMEIGCDWIWCPDNLRLFCYYRDQMDRKVKDTERRRRHRAVGSLHNHQYEARWKDSKTFNFTWKHSTKTMSYGSLYSTNIYSYLSHTTLHMVSILHIIPLSL